MEPAALTLLPELDPYTQGYADRGRYLDAVHDPWVVDRKGNVTSTVLLDGRVACQRDGTRLLPRGWDHRGASLMVSAGGR